MFLAVLLTRNGLNVRIYDIIMWELEAFRIMGLSKMFREFKDGDSRTRNNMLVDLFLQLISSYLFSVSLFQIFTQSSIKSLMYPTQIKIPILILSIVVVFVIIQIMRELYYFIKVSHCLLISAALYAIISTINNAGQPYFAIGVVITLFIFILYLFRTGRLSESGFELSTRSLIITVIIGYLLMSAIIAVSIVMRYKSHNGSTFDLGIFAQVYHYMAKTGLPLSTLERNVLLSHYAVHLSPILYLLLPLYIIFPSVEFLLIIKPLIVFSGVFPIMLICKRKKLGNSTTLIVSALYLLYPALSAAMNYDFHENIFLPPMILWTLYFIKRDRWIPIIISVILTLMIKEDAALYIIFIGLYTFFYHKKRLKGIVISGIGISYFAIAVAIINSYGLGIMDTRFENYFPLGQSGLTSVMRTLFTNPVYLITQVFTQEKVLFLILMFLPVMFICFYVRRISALLLLVPMIVINLMPAYIYQYNIGYQYVYGTGALLLYLCACNIGNIPKRNRKPMMFTAIIASLILLISTNFMTVQHNINSYRLNKDNIDATNRILDIIPLDATVTAATYFTPYLSNRDVVYMWEGKEMGTEFVVLDNRADPYDYEAYKKILEGNGYRVLNGAGYALLYRKIPG